MRLAVARLLSSISCGGRMVWLMELHWWNWFLGEVCQALGCVCQAQCQSRFFRQVYPSCPLRWAPSCTCIPTVAPPCPVGCLGLHLRSCSLACIILSCSISSPIFYQVILQCLTTCNTLCPKKPTPANQPQQSKPTQQNKPPALDRCICP